VSATLPRGNSHRCRFGSAFVEFGPCYVTENDENVLVEYQLCRLLDSLEVGQS